MSTPDNKEFAIEELIPQRPPIKMVETFDYRGDEGCRTSIAVAADNIFVDDGALACEGILEHIAQSAASYVGYRRKMKGEEVSLGYIGDIKQCQMSYPMPQVGERVETTMAVVSEIGNITMIKAKSQVEGRQVVCCTMKLAT